MTANPYILPLWLAAIFLAGFKGQWQAILVVLVAPYVDSNEAFVVVVVFGYTSWFFASWLAASRRK